ncbi:transporter substrate-binding domain-containing protein [Seongchinamella unica]|uniref:Transporter substrate-binding domain-containing protein n=1 Tax=Seongchinamella unica TaxID=2547392 RepID=A0A4R5LPC6_9GAMM|nr:HD domain-containing phosphohydrolase [Seongchinamella unica]TDG12184.1 transporter substrate-binding domain-containing protein [Seongchinamella unica]
MNRVNGRVQTTIRLTVVSVFVVATALTALVALGLQYYFSEKMARQAAAELYATTATSVASEVNAINRINHNVIDLLADNPDLADPEREAALLGIFIPVLEKNPMLYGVYVGRPDGSLFELINLNSNDKARKKMRALPRDRWLIMRVERRAGQQFRTYQYLDDRLQVRVSRDEATDYNAALRPWYQTAVTSGAVEVSKPYLFAQLDSPGLTVSKRVAGSDSVVAIDITLDTLSDFLADHALADNSGLYLYDVNGRVIASNLTQRGDTTELPSPKVSISRGEREYLDSLGTLIASNELDWPPLDYAQQGEPRGYSVDVIRMISQSLDIPIKFENGYTWEELTQLFREGEIDLLHPIALSPENRDWGLRGASHLSLPMALLTLDTVDPLDSLARLNGTTLAIPRGWTVAALIRESWPGIQVIDAESCLDAIEKVLAGEVYAALDNEMILRYLIKHYFMSGLRFHDGIDLGLQQDQSASYILSPKEAPLLRTLLDRVILSIGAEQRSYLEETWLGDYDSETVSASNTVPSSLLIEVAADPTRHGQLLSTDIAGEEHVLFASPTGTNEGAMFVGIVTPVSAVMAPFLENLFISLAFTAGILLLILPLSWLFANPIVRPVRQLADENDKVRRLEFDEVQRVESRVKELDELSESMVDMVASIRAHEKAQRDLMDAFIRLIAQAIDDKSPYTGGHCERVPELALMLADAATRSEAGPFREFALRDDEQWREYRIAAWLHDCGKITTPEHIVDKGSKLETIYNRIHEVRMRFEVLSRDKELDYWAAVQRNPANKAEYQAALERAQQELQEEFAFVAECNVGGEFLDEDKQTRLLKIAEKTWQRRFDNQLGLSPVEELRQPADLTELPVEENLLADKPEHIIKRTRSTDYDPKLGINMEVPEHQYNLGEVYNLSVSRGTLTAEDRFKINEHMISTIKMLESLPFPEELKNVPRYASTHHETMKGSGYPRKLPGDQLSIPERILAVADVFEALTASDRPYKKAKPVSVAIDILHKMVEDNHLDRDCFELFLKEGVYLEYARAYLQPDQLDEVNIQQYLG